MSSRSSIERPSRKESKSGGCERRAAISFDRILPEMPLLEELDGNETRAVQPRRRSRIPKASGTTTPTSITIRHRPAIAPSSCAARGGSISGSDARTLARRTGGAASCNRCIRSLSPAAAGVVPAVADAQPRRPDHPASSRHRRRLCRSHRARRLAWRHVAVCGSTCCAPGNSGGEAEAIRERLLRGCAGCSAA